jgi:hypothetical protein
MEARGDFGRSIWCRIGVEVCLIHQERLYEQEARAALVDSCVSVVPAQDIRCEEQIVQFDRILHLY